MPRLRLAGDNNPPPVVAWRGFLQFRPSYGFGCWSRKISWGFSAPTSPRPQRSGRAPLRPTRQNHRHYPATSHGSPPPPAAHRPCPSPRRGDRMGCNCAGGESPEGFPRQVMAHEALVPSNRAVFSFWVAGPRPPPPHPPPLPHHPQPCLECDPFPKCGSAERCLFVGTSGR